MSIYNDKTDLLDFLSIKENFLYGSFSNKFSEKIIQKKSGGQRIISPPNKKLKVVQRTILDKILKNVVYLPCVYGLTAKGNILENIKNHQQNSDGFILLLDFKDFFQSVKSNEVFKCYRKIGFNNENSKILTKLSTLNKSLPQGSPASCHLASLCLENLDKKIYKYCKYRKLIFTRYIDDVTISGESITDKNIRDLEAMIFKNGYHINSKKELLLPDNNKIIHNLSVSKNKIIVQHEYIKELEILYKKYQHEKSDKNYTRFIGKLGFYIFINKNEAHKFLNIIKGMS